MSSFMKQLLISTASGLVGLTALAMTMRDAQAIVFTNRSEWEANFVPGTIITEDFESSPSGRYILPSNPVDLGLIDIAVSQNSDELEVSSGKFTLFVTQNFDPIIAPPSEIDFRSSIFGFGFDFSQSFGSFAVSTGSDYITIPGNNGFLGIIEDEPFQTTTLAVVNVPASLIATPEITIDNLSFSAELKDTESVPEPATWTALGLLLAGLLWSRFKSASDECR